MSNGYKEDGILKDGSLLYIAKPIGMARVMEDYAMQESDELTLPRGAIVTLYERLDDGWFKGELNGRSGRFPGQVSLSYQIDDEMLTCFYLVH